MKKIWDIFGIIIRSYCHDSFNFINFCCRLRWIIKTWCMTIEYTKCSRFWSLMMASWLHWLFYCTHLSCIKLWQSICVWSICKSLHAFPKLIVSLIFHYIFRISQRSIISHWIWIAWYSVTRVNHIIPSFFKLLWRWIISHKSSKSAVSIAEITSLCIHHWYHIKPKHHIMNTIKFNNRITFVVLCFLY